MLTGLAISVLLSAAPSVSEDEGRGFVVERRLSARFGLFGGGGVGPLGFPRAGARWAGTGELGGLGELSFGSVRLRLGATLRFGGTDDYVPMATLSASAGFEFRYFFVPRFSVALGLELGALGTRLLVSPMIAPSLTLGSVHLGDRLQHELGLAATVMWWPTIGLAGGYGLLRYTYFF